MLERVGGVGAGVGRGVGGVGTGVGRGGGVGWKRGVEEGRKRVGVVRESAVPPRLVASSYPGLVCR